MEQRADVIVIGGGAVGLCAAYALQRAGREVTVLAREPVGEGASAGNAGMIVPSHITPLSAPGVIAQGLRWLLNPESPFHIRPRADLDLARWLWSFRRHATAAHVRYAAPILRDLSLASANLFAEMQADLGDLGFGQTGLLAVYGNAKTRKAVLEAADLAESVGMEVERLDADALRTAEPGLRTATDGAVLYPQDGRIDPDALLRKLAAHLRERGAVIHSGVTVEGFETQDGHITAVRTDAGPMRAETVVLAAGAWTGRLAEAVGERVPVQPGKGYSITVSAPAGAPRYPMILTDEKVTVTPMPGRLRFTGTLALAGFDPSVDARRATPLRWLARTYGPEDLSDEDIKALPVWSGFRPCSPDGLPIIGPSRRHRNLILATGHGMMGVTLAPITGQLVAALVQGEQPTIDPVPLRPTRF